ncbi:IclR family transcriptional regulator [Streptomyces sp. NPDC004539]|uniref:IclR family transcriptional regulator n=1 Tax=Streptomyces sp. NPDC004539 TaxID=3154280 RepID=UPI0033B7B9D7
MQAPPTPDSRSVIERTFDVLGAFDAGNVTLSVSEISRRAGIPVATTYRIVSKLLDWGALERIGENRYTIGLRLWEVASLSPRHAALRHAAISPMVDLHAQTHSVVMLSVGDRYEGVWLESVSGAAGPCHKTWSTGNRFPLHATACGLVLLAQAPAAVREHVYAAGLPAYTDLTTTDAGVLRGQVDQVTRRGFAVCGEELTEGIAGISVPVLDANGAGVAALGLVTESPVEDSARHIALTLEAARRISRALTRRTRESEPAPTASRAGRGRNATRPDPA